MHTVKYSFTKKRWVYITIVVVCRTKRCQRHLGTGQLSTSVTRSAWSADGRLILATTDSALHVWRAVSGGLVRSIALHTMAEFPLAVARGGRRNLVATGSTLHTAIRVWDLDAAVSCHPFPPLSGRFQSSRGVGTAGATGALAPAMLKPWGREYLFAPTIFSHIFENEMKIVYSVWQQCMLDSHNYNTRYYTLFLKLPLFVVMLPTYN